MSALCSPETAFFLVFCFLAVHAVLDGAALGVGCRVPFARDRQEADRLVGLIAPFWEAYEVWLVMALGFLFAAFPPVFAALFSGLYLPAMALIGGLIVRAAALEFSYQDAAHERAWRNSMGGASLAVVLLGSAVMGLVLRGDFGAADGMLLGLLTPQPILFGLAGVALLIWHGVLYARREPGAPRLSRAGGTCWGGVVALSLAAGVSWAAQVPTMLTRPLCLLGGLFYFGGLVASRLLSSHGRWGFRASSLAIAGFWLAAAGSLCPNVLDGNAGNLGDTLSIRLLAAPASTLQLAVPAALVMIVVIACYSRLVSKVIRRKGKAHD